MQAYTRVPWYYCYYYYYSLYAFSRCVCVCQRGAQRECDKDVDERRQWLGRRLAGSFGSGGRVNLWATFAAVYAEFNPWNMSTILWWYGGHTSYDRKGLSLGTGDISIIQFCRTIVSPRAARSSHNILKRRASLQRETAKPYARWKRERQDEMDAEWEREFTHSTITPDVCSASYNRLKWVVWGVWGG